MTTFYKRDFDSMRHEEMQRNELLAKRFSERLLGGVGTGRREKYWMAARVCDQPLGT